jgi:hypothetical protein
VLTPSPVIAQGTPYAMLTVSMTQAYEDNLLAASRSQDRLRDATMRIGPALEAGYVSVPLRLSARYAFDAERYFDHHTLSRGFARQDAAIELRHQPTRRLALDLEATYRQTYSPLEFNLESGLASGRARGERFGAASVATYAWTPLNDMNVGYAFTRDALEGGIATAIGEARLGFARHDVARRARRVEYRFQHFSFADRGSEAWHIVTAGWSRDITRRTAIELTLGPRVGRGRVRPEFGAVVRRLLQKGALSASYSRTQATAIGDVGAIDVQRVAASVVYQAARRVTLTAAPAFAISARGGTQVSVYTVDLEASGRTRRGVSVVLSGRLGLQRGTLAGQHEEIPHRRVSLGLVATLPPSLRARRTGEPR